MAVAVPSLGSLLYVRRLLPAESSGTPRSSLVAVRGDAGAGDRRLDALGRNPRQYTFDFISGEMWTGQYLWGYLMTASRSS